MAGSAGGSSTSPVARGSRLGSRRCPRFAFASARSPRRSQRAPRGSLLVRAAVFPLDARASAAGRPAGEPEHAEDGLPEEPVNAPQQHVPFPPGHPERERQRERGSDEEDRADGGGDHAGAAEPQRAQLCQQDAAGSPAGACSSGPVGQAERRAADGGEEDRERRQRDAEEPPRQPAVAEKGPGPGAEDQWQQGSANAEPLQQQVRTMSAGSADEIGRRGGARAVEGGVGRRVGDQRGADDDREAAQREPGEFAQPAGEECPRARRQERRARVACGACYQLQPRDACSNESNTSYVTEAYIVQLRKSQSCRCGSNRVRTVRLTGPSPWNGTQESVTVGIGSRTPGAQRRDRLCATICIPGPNAGADDHGHSRDPSAGNPRRLRGAGHRRRLPRVAGAGRGGRPDRERTRRPPTPGAADARSSLPHRELHQDLRRGLPAAIGPGGPGRPRRAHRPAGFPTCPRPRGCRSASSSITGAGCPSSRTTCR